MLAHLWDVVEERPGRPAESGAIPCRSPAAVCGTKIEIVGQVVFIIPVLVGQRYKPLPIPNLGRRRTVGESRKNSSRTVPTLQVGTPARTRTDQQPTASRAKHLYLCCRRVWRCKRLPPGTPLYPPRNGRI